MTQLQNLIGHDGVKELLLNLIHRGNMPHAFLFHGPQGVGKTTFAKVFAATLAHQMDVRVYARAQDEETHTIDSIRELIAETALPPHDSSHKVFIIEDAHKMLATGSNALLKTLEEPSSPCIFILLAPNIADLLPTISSRCCKVAFASLSNQEVAAFLVQHGMDEQKAKTLAPFAFGSFGKASAYLQEESQDWQRDFIELILTFKELSYQKLQEQLTILDKLFEKEETACAVEISLYLVRDLILVQHGLMEVYFQDKIDLLQKASKQIALSNIQMQRVWEVLHESLTAHVKFKTAFEVFLICLYEEKR